MKKTTLTIIGTALLLGAGIYAISMSPRDNSTTTDRPAPKPDHKLSYTGAIPYFAVQEALVSLQQNISKLDTVTSFIYFVEPDGSISRREGVSEEAENQVLELAMQTSTEILVGIENDENPELVENLLSDATTRQQHINAVIQLLNTKGYAGIVVDFENLQTNQAPGFTSFMRELSSAVKAAGKTIGISVNTELTDRVWHGIDVVAIAPLVDRLELNAYEEFSQYTDAGPVASVGWVNTILRNVIAQGVPPQKIILGTAHGGHEWITTNGSDEFVEDTSARKMLERRAQLGVPLVWDNESQSNFFQYQDNNGQNRVVWIEDQQSFAAKINLAKAYELQGMFLWYLGGEDPAVWQEVGR